MPNNQQDLEGSPGEAGGGAAAAAAPPDQTELYADFTIIVGSVGSQRLHSHLLDVLQEVALRGRAKGVCDGITTKWLEAKMLGDEAVFVGRLGYIASQSAASFADKVKRAKQNSQNKLAAGPEERRVFDALAFFESLMLYHQPINYARLLGCSNTQYDTDKIAEIAASDKIRAVGGFACTDVEIISCNMLGLISLLHDIKCNIDAMVQRDGSHSVIALKLRNSEHAMGLAYDTKAKQFSFLDINCWPPIVGGLDKVAGPIFRRIIADAKSEKEPKHGGLFLAQLLLTKQQRDAFPAIERLLAKHNVYDVGTDALVCPEGSKPRLAYFAAHLGRIDIIRKMIQLGDHLRFDFDHALYNGFNLLCLSAGQGRVEVARVLLQHGAKADIAVDDNRFPLFVAARAGHADMVDLLLDHDAKVNQANADGHTALSFAAGNGHIAVAQLLLIRGAKVEPVVNGRSPLCIASMEGWRDMACLLLSHGASVDGPVDNGMTPLCLASKYGRSDVVRVLLEHHAVVDRPNARSDTPLFVAACNGRVEAACVLLERGAVVDRPVGGGRTPLCAAAYKGDVDMVRLLLDHHASIDLAMANGATPLLLAIQHGRIDVMRLLLQHNAMIDKSRIDGVTALFLASQKGFLAVVKALLKAGVSAGVGPGYINQPSKDGVTPFFIAAQNGNVAIVKVLLQAGANARTPIVLDTEGLRAYIQTCPNYIEQRLQQHISRAADPSAVSVMPVDMARIVGCDAVAETIDRLCPGLAESPAERVYPRPAHSVLFGGAGEPVGKRRKGYGGVLAAATALPGLR